MTDGNTTKSGIKLLATPKTGGYNWELDISKDPNSDSNFEPEGGKCTQGSDGSVKFWNMKGKTVNYASGNPSGITNRLSIYFDGGKGNKQTHTWKDQTGFLWKQGDPKNYVVISTIRTHHSLAANIHHESSIKNRGGTHSGSNDPRASTVELTQEMAGNTPRWAREYDHPNYDYNKVDEAGPNAKNLGIVPDKWFMRQLISRELADGTGVSYEYYINVNPFNADGSVNNDNWELYSKVVDKDGFNSGKYKVAAKWSAFMTTVRIDGFQDIDISHHAFIEIIGSNEQPSPTPTPTPTPIPTPVPPTPSTTNPTPRVQTRQTSEAGEDVDDSKWEIKSDTGAIAAATPTPTPTPGGTLKIAAATGSTADGTNVAANAIDNDPNTRFSSLGVGAFLKLDFGAVQEIDKIDFDWYNSPPRTYTVDVIFEGAATLNHTSDDTGKSSLAVPSIDTQTITIKLVDTSNVKKWLSIVDVRVSGKQLNESPITPVPVPPQPTPTPVPPTPTTTLDSFGLQKIYEDLPAPYRQWHHTSVDDPLYYEQKPKDLGNGWLTFPSLVQGRIEVLPMVGLKDTDIETYYYPDVVKKGYLHLPRDDPSGNGDWGDLEMSIALRNVVPGSGSFESHFEFVRGGFRQSTSNQKAGKDGKVIVSCEAMSIHSGIYPSPGSNRSKFEKDTLHNTGYTAHDPEFKPLPKEVDQKAGYIFKTVYYRVADAAQLGGYSMKMEQYVSLDGLTGKSFKMIGEYLDNGKWGPTKQGVAHQCGCPNEFPIHSMDICCPGIRIDWMKSFEFSKFSIRSINPKKKLIS